jgi:hypothetical protein
MHSLEYSLLMVSRAIRKADTAPKREHLASCLAQLASYSHDYPVPGPDAFKYDPSTMHHCGEHVGLVKLAETLDFYATDSDLQTHIDALKAFKKLQLLKDKR